MPFLAALPLAAIGTAAGIAGTGIAAFSAIRQGQTASAAAGAQGDLMSSETRQNALITQTNAQIQQNNAQIAKQGADAAQAAGDVQQTQLAQKQRQFAGAIKAGYAGSGVTMEGTPLEVMNQNTRMMETDLLNQQYNTAVAVTGKKQEAQQYTTQADILESEAGFQGQQADYYSAAGGATAGAASTAGYLGAGTTLLGGAYKFLGPNRPSFGPDMSSGGDITA